MFHGKCIQGNSFTLRVGTQLLELEVDQSMYVDLLIDNTMSFGHSRVCQREWELLFMII